MASPRASADDYAWIMNPFQIMSEPIRRRIIEVLASGEHTAGNLCDVIVAEFGVTRPAVFHHLAILRDNGWVDIVADYTTRHYRLEPDVWKRLDAEVRWLKQLWKRRIGSLSGNDTDPRLAAQPESRRYPRGAAGSVKGLRGTGRRASRLAFHSSWPFPPMEEGAGGEEVAGAGAGEEESWED
jgi:DNA-binding transcriptional ArsR family regulator